MAALAVAIAVGGCGSDGSNPVEVRLKEQTADQTVLGFPALATKNTTRVGGKDPIADAAGTAAAAYPGQTRGTRPQAVAMVDQDDWRAGIAASVLMASPLHAPIVLTDGSDVPDAAATALDTMQPTGARAAAGAQALEIGAARAPDDLRARSISGGNPFRMAAAIDAFATDVAGRPSPNVVLVSASAPEFAMPAAAWAAKSGNAVLFTERTEIPPETRRALAKHEQPGIYILGPPDIVSKSVERSLNRLGRVKRISGRTPAANAIAFARYSDAAFGWGVRDPGHGLVFANPDRTADAAAAAALAGSGTYGPLLLVESANRLGAQLENYLADIQPGYRFDPVRGVYNHAWLLGDEDAIDLTLQARIDELCEITKVRDENL